MYVRIFRVNKLTYISFSFMMRNYLISHNDGTLNWACISFDSCSIKTWSLHLDISSFNVKVIIITGTIFIRSLCNLSDIPPLIS